MTKAMAIETTVQKTHEWLGRVSEGLGFENERAAYAALRATLHGLRDRLPTELVVHFGAGLPMLIRGMYYEGWHSSATSLRAARDEDFLDALRRQLKGHDELQNAERVARVVLRVLDECLSPGQVEHVLKSLPPQVHERWREAEETEDIQ